MDGESRAGTYAICFFGVFLVGVFGLMFWNMYVKEQQGYLLRPTYIMGENQFAVVSMVRKQGGYFGEIRLSETKEDYAKERYKTVRFPVRDIDSFVVALQNAADGVQKTPFSRSGLDPMTSYSVSPGYRTFRVNLVFRVDNQTITMRIRSEQARSLGVFLTESKMECV